MGVWGGGVMEGTCQLFLSRDAQWWHEWEQSRSCGSRRMCVATAERSRMAQSKNKGRVSVWRACKREAVPQKYVFLLSPEDSESCSHACSLAGNHTAQVEHLWHLSFLHLWTSPGGFVIPAECCGICEMVVLEQDMSTGPVPWGTGSGGDHGSDTALVSGSVQRAEHGAGHAFDAYAAQQKGCCACSCWSFPQICGFISSYS